MSPPSPTRRAIAVAVAVVLALEVGWLVVSVLRRAPRGPESSSYAAGHRGARAYASLLERGGHDVRRQRVPFDVEPADPRDTVVILGGSSPEPAEVQALLQFVRRGGRLVVAGDESADRWLPAVTGSGLPRQGELLACHPLADVPETAGVEMVESSGQPGWLILGSALPILGCNGVTLAAIAPLGEGRVVMVSDDAVFQNYLLGARDNATFALAAAGGVRRDVVFLEHLHGFDAPSGLAALPGRWQLAAALAAAGAVLLVVARRPLRSPAPAPAGGEHPRSLHAEAVAARLDATGVGEAAGLARDAARRALADAAGVTGRASVEELRQAGIRLGVDPDDLQRTLDPRQGGDRAGTAAAGRVLAACLGPRPPRTKEPHA